MTTTGAPATSRAPAIPITTRPTSRFRNYPLGPERQALVKRLNDILVQSYVEIPLVSRGLVSAHAASLQGVRFNAWDSELWNIAEWRR